MAGLFFYGALLNFNKVKNIKYFKELEALVRLKEILKDHNLELTKALIAYIFSLNKLSMVIMGTTSLDNLIKIYQLKNSFK